MIDWKKQEDKYVLTTYDKFPFVLERGEGNYVWDDAGNRYLDFYGGHAVSILGHCPAEVADAIAAQSRKLLFYSNLAYSRLRAEAGRALVELCGDEGSQVFFCNSGAEANENAMKVARLATGRPKILATAGSFHGRTAGALAATGVAKYKKNPAGLGADVAHVPFGDLAAAEAAIGKDVAGFLLEPIQSMAGIVEPPAGYLAGLRKLCDERGALLIFDEVQTGLGRVGAPSAAKAYGVRPDISTFAKGLGSGIPVAATLMSAAAASKVKPGELGSTFGGGPVACAAVFATLQTISSRRLWENAAKMEALVRSTIRSPRITAIRGKGLLLGIVLDGPCKPVKQALLERRILAGGADDPNVLRLLPPLTIGGEEVEALRAALAEILA